MPLRRAFHFLATVAAEMPDSASGHFYARRYDNDLMPPRQSAPLRKLVFASLLHAALQHARRPPPIKNAKIAHDRHSCAKDEQQHIVLSFSALEFHEFGHMLILESTIQRCVSSRDTPSSSQEARCWAHATYAGLAEKKMTISPPR